MQKAALEFVFTSFSLKEGGWISSASMPPLKKISACFNLSEAPLPYIVSAPLLSLYMGPLRSLLFSNRVSTKYRPLLSRSHSRSTDCTPARSRDFARISHAVLCRSFSFLNLFSLNTLQLVAIRYSHPPYTQPRPIKPLE